MVKTQILKIDMTVTNPNGLKLLGSIENLENVVFNYDFSKTQTYPAQTNPVAVGTEFVNLSKNTNYSGITLKTAGKTIPYTGSAINFNNTDDATSTLQGALPFASKVTDVVVKVKFKPASTASGVKEIISADSNLTGVANTRANFKIMYDHTNQLLYIFGLGVALATVPCSISTDHEVLLYLKPNSSTLGGAGFVKLYLDGVLVNTTATNTASFGSEVSAMNLRSGFSYQGLIYNILIAQDLYASGIEHTIFL